MSDEINNSKIDSKKISDAESRINYLRKEIRRHSKLYYENDAPEITDYEYDMIFPNFIKTYVDNDVRGAEKP